jgi:hypothetical protein
VTQSQERGADRASPDQASPTRIPLSAAFSIAAMIRCTATASSKFGAVRGDFNGVASDGSIQGLLFPASVEFSPDKSRLYITNLALYLPFAGVPTIAVDSGWTLQIKHNIAVIDVPPRG